MIVTYIKILSFPLDFPLIHNTSQIREYQFIASYLAASFKWLSTNLLDDMASATMYHSTKLTMACPEGFPGPVSHVRGV